MATGAEVEEVASTKLVEEVGAIFERSQGR